ncbi:MAG: hypothetical protein MJ202_00150 [Lentisphaeria bacterium]|nr:hypothetical protein [Lentisphaeria bacterium]
MFGVGWGWLEKKRTRASWEKENRHSFWPCQYYKKKKQNQNSREVQLITKKRHDYAFGQILESRRLSGGHQEKGEGIAGFWSLS